MARSCALPGELTSGGRRRLPDRAFGLPSVRKYPMYRMVGTHAVPSGSHAANAKSRASAAYNKGQITAAQYSRIVRKANRVLRECKVSGRPRKRKKVAKKRVVKRRKKNTTKVATEAERRAALRAWQRGDGKS